jgi:serine protease Do
LAEDGMKKLFCISLAAVVMFGLTAGHALAKSDTSAKRAWLGVYSQTVDEDLAEAFDLPLDYGVIINEVMEDSPAEEAGLQEDDIIIKIDGRRITDQEDLVEAIEDRRPGDEIVLTVRRDEQELEIPVTLEKRPSIKKRIRFHKGPKSYTFSMHCKKERSYIGVSLVDLTRQLGDYFGVKKGRGALVTEVLKDSPAEEAGLKAGDVIISIDGEKVADADDVQELIEDYEPGDKVKIVVVRNRKEKSFSVEVGETEDSPLSWFYGQAFSPDIYLKAIPKRFPAFDKELEIEFDEEDVDLALDEFKEEMKKFKKEMKSLKKELEELRHKLEQ